jgi:LPS export ABC transporter permease LptF
MRTLRNYILKEFFGPLLLSLALLTFVMLLGNIIKIAEMIINKGADIVSVGKLFIYLVPYLLTYTLPIACLTTALVSLGRLASDNEIVAIRASGINILHLIIPLIIVGLIFSLVLVVFNDYVVPYTHFASRKTLIEIGIKNPAIVLEPGVFINAFDKYILFVYRIEQNKLFHIRIYEPRGESKPARTIVAKRGEFISLPEKNIVKLKLMDGTSDELDPANPNTFYKLNFKTYFMTLNLAKTGDNKVEKKPKDMTFRELAFEINKIKKSQLDPAPLIAQLHERISLAFSCLVFMLLGCPLALLTRRREKSINLALAFFIVGTYYLLFLGADALSSQGWIRADIAMWGPNIIFGLLGIGLILKICAY